MDLELQIFRSFQWTTALSGIDRLGEQHTVNVTHCILYLFIEKIKFQTYCCVEQKQY